MVTGMRYPDASGSDTTMDPMKTKAGDKNKSLT